MTGLTGMVHVLVQFVSRFTKRREAILSQQEQESDTRHARQPRRQPCAEPARLVQLERQQKTSFRLKLVRFLLQGP